MIETIDSLSVALWTHKTNVKIIIDFFQILYGIALSGIKKYTTVIL